MLIYKNTQYTIGYSQGKYTITIPDFKFFKEYPLKQDKKNYQSIITIAQDLINEEIIKKTNQPKHTNNGAEYNDVKN